MGNKDLIDLILNAKDKIYFFWNFYVTGIVAVMAWRATIPSTISWKLKAIVTAGYLIFMAMNISGLLSSFALYSAAIKDYLAFANKVEKDNENYHVYQVFSKSSSIFKPINLLNFKIPRYKLVVYGLHILIDLSIVLIIFNSDSWIAISQ